jgi:hypothetical protein
MLSIFQSFHRVSLRVVEGKIDTTNSEPRRLLQLPDNHNTSSSMCGGNPGYPIRKSRALLSASRVLKTLSSSDELTIRVLLFPFRHRQVRFVFSYSSLLRLAISTLLRFFAIFILHLATLHSSPVTMRYATLFFAASVLASVWAVPILASCASRRIRVRLVD